MEGGTVGNGDFNQKSYPIADVGPSTVYLRAHTSQVQHKHSCLKMSQQDEDQLEQPKVTIVNLDADVEPRIFRVDMAGVAGTTDVLLRLATLFKEEDALIVNLTVTQHSICFVGALKDDWVPRIQRALHGDDAEYDG
ncbi:hypothetical protein M413DRAFT_439180 [Hebeloma cylindrosporum]|uniref:Uncharacterized protein n=1 Tax=Hebeloma cylindrosporum TaxID=76867 RepID=A0A0C2YCE0_HEBCY|nr:hypothetical protein M413DRAFT_439180 [Hebeloma cylindrosporum h7]